MTEDTDNSTFNDEAMPTTLLERDCHQPRDEHGFSTRVSYKEGVSVDRTLASLDEANVFGRTPRPQLHTQRGV